MWARVDSLRNAKIEPRPEGSFTAQEYWERYHLSQTTARTQLNRLVDSGVLRKIHCWEPDTRGHVRKTIVYCVPNVSNS